ncbi:hypothetical protein ACM66B_006783 [Microbotryomycetes sp. NB124-2]
MSYVTDSNSYQKQQGGGAYSKVPDEDEWHKDEAGFQDNDEGDDDERLMVGRLDRIQKRNKEASLLPWFKRRAGRGMNGVGEPSYSRRARWIAIAGGIFVLVMLLAHSTSSTTSSSFEGLDTTGQPGNLVEPLADQTTSPFTSTPATSSGSTSKLEAIKHYWNEWWKSSQSVKELEEETYGKEAPGEAESVEDALARVKDEEQMEGEAKSQQQGDDDDGQADASSEEEESVQDEEGADVPGKGAASPDKINSDELRQETADDGEAKETPVVDATLPLVKPLNVRPNPRPPPVDPVAASSMRYVAYESHSGFHNQRKALVNALLVSRMLNRTLLLPPVRLGHAISWDPHLDTLIPVHERCKSFRPSQADDNDDETCVNVPQADKWTYVDWTFIMPRRVFEGHSVVDRWNDSTLWWTNSPSRGGLGLESLEKDVFHFQDDDRYSYQIYDSEETKTSLGRFHQRLNIDSLLNDERFSNKKVLHFGSLFGGDRVKAGLEDNLREWERINEAMVFEIEGVDETSEVIRDRLGSYVGVHCRVGDMFFKNKAKQNMQVVFRKLAKTVFGLKQKRITQLLDQTEASLKKQERRRGRGRHRRWINGWPNRFTWTYHDDDVEDQLDETTVFDSPETRVRFNKRALATPNKPMSSTLKCRKPLQTDLELLPLNKPLYMATDSRDPVRDPNLRPFFDHFPCLFLLKDFAGVEDQQQENSGEDRVVRINSEPVEGLVELIKGGERWTSEWDGQSLSTYMLPFLEAEIAAKADAAVGTVGSTFSGYATVTLHEAYKKLGQAAS